MDIFQPSKVDIFIIKGYKIITNGTILNSYHITTSSSSPLNNNNSTNNSSNSNDPEETDNEGMNNGKTPRRKKKSSVIHPQYSKTFFKLSKIYSSLLPSGLFGEVSTSPKSDIELFQRFQQILKELELNFEMSAYSKYFNRVSETLFQIKEDNELAVDDPFWIGLTESVLNFYNPRTGKLINQGRKKNVIKRNISAGKNDEKKNTENNSNSNGNNNNNNDNGNTNNNNSYDFFNMTNSMLNDPALSLQLQRKLQMIPQDITSRSLNGYYTQPTSPGSGGFPFNLGTGDDDDILGNNFNNSDVAGITFNSNDNNNNSNNNNNGNGNGNVPLQNGINGNYNYLNHKKRRSLGSLSLDESAVDDLLKFTTINKKQRTPQSFSNMIDDFRFQSNGTVNDKGPLTKMNNVQMLDKDGNLTANDNINIGGINTNDPGTSTSLPGNDMNSVTNQQGNTNTNSVPNTNIGNTLDVNSNIDASNTGSLMDQVSNNGPAGGNNGMLTTLNNGMMDSTNNNNNNNNNQNNKEGNVDVMNDNNRMQLNNLNMADATRMNNMQITPESTMNSNPANINVSGNTGDSSTSAMTSSAFSGHDSARILQNTNNSNAANSQRFEALVNELNQKYDAIIVEKDKRISSLEAELESQRQETMWLRKMLIEDMGYIRNFLQNSQR
ncbi:hypothetical protein C6P45_000471 [Maudiozyma exigua]|uniref:Uncharacterized protein n=1 Tax=Maudiozyma exigua TaxID=34358 RepID=A0A9P6W8Q8_MAUEX|nr:hypothetical protein C6P45_000471 [Kazachstania exigua]